MPYEVIDGIPVWGQTDEGAMSQARTVAKTAFKVALMADNHKGYAVPIGGVVAYKDAISPSGVGYDIGCGNRAVLLDMEGSVLRANIETIMDDVWETLSFGVGLKNKQRVDHALFDSEAWKLPAISGLKELARGQLGTIGSGNHYVDLFTDELDRVWVGVHFGSRGFGHKTATYFLEQAGAKDGMDVEPAIIPVNTALGTDYIQAMRLAGEYADAGREWVCKRVANLLGAPILETVANHHNFAWEEEHYGEKLWVVRKGATPAFPGQKGFVGGTMTSNAVILEGAQPRGPFLDQVARDVREQEMALFSTVHGAGRVMGRMQALGKPERINKSTGEIIPARIAGVTQEMMDADVAASGIELRGAGRDESAFCYKRLTDVLAAHSQTVNILHQLNPVGVAMAGRDVRDPYQD